MSRRRTQASQEAEEEQSETIEGPVRECVRYIICREGSKLPLKRSEMLKHLANTCQLPSSKVNTTLSEANKLLKRIYGYKLVQVEAKSGIQYIVVLNEECDKTISTTTDPTLRILLNVCLLHLFMSGGTVKEDDMWRFLEKAGLIEEHEQNKKKILTNVFTKQLYLTYSKIGEGDMTKYVFEWGQRAIEEAPKMFMLKKFGEAIGKEPDHWAEQYKLALKEYEENAAGI